MNIDALIHTIAQKGISLSVENGQLSYEAHESAINDEILSLLRDNKAALIDWLTLRDAISTADLIAKPTGAKAELTSAQKRYWLTDNGAGAGSSYNIPFALTLRGPLDRDALNFALVALVERHKVLRTCYVQEGDQIQIVYNQNRLRINEVDLSSVPTEDRQQRLDATLHDVLQTSFDLTADLMLKVSLITCSETEHVLVLVFHHIAMDGWSIGLVTQELSALYKGRLGNDQFNIEMPALQYEDYAYWLSQADNQRQEQLENGLKYWRRRLQNAPSLHSLALDKERGSKQSFSGKTFNDVISPNLVKRLEAFCATRNITLFSVMLGAYSMMLSRWGGEQNVVVGTPVANREMTAISNMIGCFVNTLPMHMQVDHEQSVDSYFDQLQKQVIQDLQHQDIPVDNIISDCGVARTGNANPLFQILFSFQNNEIGELDFGPVEIEALELPTTASPFELNLIVSQQADNALLKWEYCSDLFYEQTIRAMSQTLQTLLLQVVDSPQTCIKDLDLVNQDQRSQLQMLATLDTPKHYSYPLGYMQALTDVCVHNAKRDALVHRDNRMTYQELIKRVGSLGYCLSVLHTVRPGDRVVVCLPQSLDWVVAMLGVWYIGAVYVPVDKKLPKDRIANIVEDCGAALVVTHSDANHLFSDNLDVINVDGQFGDSLTWMPQAELASLVPQQEAYIVFTSGSTGKPKGVPVTQQNLVDHMASFTSALDVGEQDKVLQFLSLSIDGSIEQIMLALLSGAELHLRDQELWTMEECAEYIKQKGISVTDLPVSYLERLLSNEEALHNIKQSHLRLLSTGGDVVGRHIVAQWHDKGVSKQVQLVNAYGPSETTISSTLYFVEPQRCYESVPIGKPLPGTHALVVDQYDKIAAPNMVGELLLGGECVSPGYLSEVALNNRKFTVNPHQPSDRVFRTGDLVRVRRDGNIEFMGRKDQQVKIRGFRVELNEIELAALSNDYISQAAVKVFSTEQGSKQLVLYVVVADTEHRLDMAQLRTQLHATLPHYMWPTSIIELPVLPLKSNGKLDKDQLPAPQSEAASSGQQEQMSDLEKGLCQIWQRVLRVDSVSVYDNFFALGGDSILAIQIVANAKKKGLSLTSSMIFDKPSVKELASAISVNHSTEAHQAFEGELGLLPQQREFLHSDNVRHHYNQSLLLPVSETLTKDQLTNICRHLLIRHPALRQCFTCDEGNWTSHVHTVDEQLLDRLSYYEGRDIQGGEKAGSTRQVLEEVDMRLQSSTTDLSFPPVRLAYVGDAEGRGFVLLVCHHLLVDFVSMSVLFSELQDLVSCSDEQLNDDIPSYFATPQYLQDLAVTSESDSEKWHKLLLPSRPFQFCPSGDYGRYEDDEHVEIRADAKQVRAMVERLTKLYKLSAEDCIQLAILGGLAEHSGKHEVGLLCEGTGRNFAGLSSPVDDTIGWFTSVFPVLLSADETDLHKRIENLKLYKQQLPSRGITFSSGQGSAELSAWTDNYSPDIVVNFLGAQDLSEVTDLDELQWSPDNISGAANRTEALTVTVGFEGEYLKMTFNFAGGVIEKQSIVQLSQRVVRNFGLLEKLAEETDVGHYSAQDFPYIAIEQSEIGELTQQFGCIEQIYPATDIQSGMLYRGLKEGAQVAYLTQTHFTFSNGFNPDAFRQAWQTVIDRHGALRTVFSMFEQSGMGQVVLAQYRPKWHESDWTDKPESVCASAFEQFLNKDANTDFVEGQVAMRFQLIRESEQWRFVWTHHHALLDGWSVSRLFAEVSALYEARVKAESANLPVAVSSEDYFQWLANQSSQESEGFWQTKLLSKRPLWLTSREQTPGVHYLDRHCDKALSQQVERMAKEYHVSVASLLQTAWSVLLCRLAKHTDIVYGLTVSGRPDAVATSRDMVGMFINSVPVVASYDERQSIRELVQSVHSEASDANVNGMIPVSKIQSMVDLPAEKPLFNCLFVFENYPRSESQKGSAGGGMEITASGALEYSEYPVTLIMGYSDTLSAMLLVDKHCMTEGQANSLMNGFSETLRSLVFADKNTQVDAWLKQSESIQSDLTCLEPIFVCGPSLTQAVVKRNQTATRLPQTEIERALADIWTQLLAVDDIGVLDNFHDVGGNSLLAMRLVGKIRKKWGFNYPVTEFMQEATIAAIAKRLEKYLMHSAVVVDSSQVNKATTELVI